MRLYYFLTTLLNPLALGWMRLKTRLRSEERVRVIVVNDKNEVLLVRPVMGVRKWELPGGMAKRGESFETAAARELFEETGIRIRAIDLGFVIEYLRPYPMRIYQVHVSTRAIHKNVFEIRDAQWFSFLELPSNVVPFVAGLLKRK